MPIIAPLQTDSLNISPDYFRKSIDVQVPIVSFKLFKTHMSFLSSILIRTGLNVSTGHRTMSSKKRVMSDETCFTKDTVVRSEVKKIFFTDVLNFRSIR